MLNPMFRPIRLAFVLLAASVALAFGAEKKNLVPEGDFNAPDAIDPSAKNGGLWKCFPGAGDYRTKRGMDFTQEQNEEGDKFIRIVNASTDAAYLSIQVKLVEPRPKALRASCRIRTKDIVTDPKVSWAGAHFALDWIGADGKILRSTGLGIRTTQNIPEWKEVEVLVQVPAEATALAIKPGLWHTSGTLDIDDFVLTAE